MAHPTFWPTKSFFYPIGNTSPVHLAQNLPREENARILLLGCGDPRNILYSLHAAAADEALAVRQFDITCNDIEPAIFARNILLFTLVADAAYFANASHIWNIFYHYFLDDASHKVLISQCLRLAQLSTDMETWRASEYSSFIRISSRFTLAELNRLWTLYAGTASLSTARKKRFKEEFVTGMKTIARNELNGSNTTAARSAGPLYTQALELTADASRHYWRTGVTFDSQREVAAAIHVNPTFAFATQGQGFVTHYGTSVLAAFHLAASLAVVEGQPPRKSTPTIFDIFRDARRQFRSWCEAARVCFTQYPGRVTIRFLLGDVLAVCRTLQEFSAHGRTSVQERVSAWDHRALVLDGDDYDLTEPTHAPRNFNVIDTSNLSDHIGMLNILLAAGPLLSREPWASLSTETLLSAGEDPQKSFTERLCGDTSTMFLLLDLAPVSYVSGFSTHSNAHEVVGLAAMKLGNAGLSPQFHERMLWKVPSLAADSVLGQSPLGFDVPDLVILLHNIYCRMFWHENMRDKLATLFAGQLSLANLRDQGRVRYCRRTFALLVGFLIKRIRVDWSAVFPQFINMVANDPALKMSISMNFFQDLICNFHVLGLYTEPTWAADPSLVSGAKEGRLRNWINVPPVVCVVLSVPRERTRVFEDDGLPGNPNLDMRIEGGPFCNAFTFLQTGFGSVAIAGEGENARTIITPDPKGKHGSSDVVAAAWIPTWMLCVLPHDTGVALGVVSTPTSTPFTRKLGLSMRVYQAPLADTNRVFVSAFPPICDPETDAYTPAISRGTQPQAIPSNLHPRVALDRSATRIASITQRVDVTVPASKNVLAMPSTKVEARVIGPGRLALHIGEACQQVLEFPLLGNISAPKLRVARKSSYVEVVIAVPESGSQSLKDFPLTRHMNKLSPWNLHIVSLDRLPALRADDPSTSSWLNPHVSLSLSDRERRELELGVPKALFTEFKESLLAMTRRFIGFQCDMACPVLALRSSSAGGVDTLFFVTHLRLDLPAHTVVFDAFVLILDNNLRHQLGPIIPVPFATMNITTEELVLWKRLLPALVERCRTWSHKDDCEYLDGTIPRSTAYGGVPICSCGKGIVTDAFKSRKEWLPYAPYVTRVALSPLFALSYLESIAGRGIEAPKDVKGDPSQLLAGAGKMHCKACKKALPAGKVSVCSACKSVSYCGKDCQLADWKRHKHECQK